MTSSASFNISFFSIGITLGIGPIPSICSALKTLKKFTYGFLSFTIFFSNSPFSVSSSTIFDQTHFSNRTDFAPFFIRYPCLLACFNVIQRESSYFPTADAIKSLNKLTPWYLAPLIGLFGSPYVLTESHISRTGDTPSFIFCIS